MNDLISRQAAIDAIERLILPQTKGETAAEEINRVAWRCAINCAEEMIGHLPSAERRGRWVAHDGEYEYALQNIADMFDPPCCYSYNSQDGADFMLEHAEGFCEECDYHTYAECWRKYFEVLRQMEATE